MKKPYIKLFLLGNIGTGRTTINILFNEGVLPTDYIPVVSRTCIKEMSVDEIPVRVSLWETDGAEDIDRLRPLDYPKTDVFLLFFALNNRESFDSLKDRWVPEVRQHCPEVPIIVIGTKSDLRETETDLISEESGRELAETIKAVCYMECSSFSNVGINEFVEKAVQVALEKKKKTKKCEIL